MFCKFAGFNLWFYYQGTSSRVFCKDKGSTLDSFLWIRRATTFRNNFLWLLLYVSLLYLHKRKKGAKEVRNLWILETATEERL